MSFNCYSAAQPATDSLRCYNYVFSPQLLMQVERERESRHTLPIDSCLRDQKNKPSTAAKHAANVSQGNITK